MLQLIKFTHDIKYIHITSTAVSISNMINIEHTHKKRPQIISSTAKTKTS